MRRTFVLIVFLLVLQGCADYQARRQIIEQHRPGYLVELRDVTLAPYREWRQEVPRDCHSPKLMDARASVLHTALLIRPEWEDGLDGYEAAYAAAGWILDVADGAAARGCVATARDLYVKVEGIYIGAGYARLRERASAAMARLSS
ncbi:MAG TPA: hypothetical protein VJN67_23325 [Stellaceae bacterium]|nr:hypothetical protein [Stellaceae bacterium]